MGKSPPIFNDINEYENPPLTPKVGTELSESAQINCFREKTGYFVNVNNPQVSELWKMFKRWIFIEYIKINPHAHPNDKFLRQVFEADCIFNIWPDEWYRTFYNNLHTDKLERVATNPTTKPIYLSWVSFRKRAAGNGKK